MPDARKTITQNHRSIFPRLTPKHFLSTKETSPSGNRQLPSKSARRVSSTFLVYPNPASEQGSIQGRGTRRARSDPREFFPQLPRAITPNRSILDSTDDFFTRGKEEKGKERKKGEKGRVNKHSLALASRKEEGRSVKSRVVETWLEN